MARIVRRIVQSSAVCKANHENERGTGNEQNGGDYARASAKVLGLNSRCCRHLHLPPDRPDDGLRALLSHHGRSPGLRFNPPNRLPSKPLLVALDPAVFAYSRAGGRRLGQTVGTDLTAFLFMPHTREESEATMTGAPLHGTHQITIII